MCGTDSEPVTKAGPSVDSQERNILMLLLSFFLSLKTFQVPAAISI